MAEVQGERHKGLARCREGKKRHREIDFLLSRARRRLEDRGLVEEKLGKRKATPFTESCLSWSFSDAGTAGEGKK